MPLFFWFNQFLDSRAEIPEIILLVFWKKLSFHKNIIELTDLYIPTLQYNKYFRWVYLVFSLHTPHIFHKIERLHRKYFTRLKDFSFELLYAINVNGMSKGEAHYFKLHIFHGRWRYRMSSKICNSRFSYKITAKLLNFKKQEQVMRKDYV